MLHNCGIDTHAGHQHEVMLSCGCCLHLLLTFLLPFLLSLLVVIVLRCIGKRKPVHLDMSDINLASFAVAKGKSGMYGVIGHANFSRPDIGSTTGNDANDARMLPGTHYSIEDLIQRTIASVTYDQ